MFKIDINDRDLYIALQVKTSNPMLNQIVKMRISELKHKGAADTVDRAISALKLDICSTERFTIIEKTNETILNWEEEIDNIVYALNRALKQKELPRSEKMKLVQLSDNIYKKHIIDEIKYKFGNKATIELIGIKWKTKNHEASYTKAVKIINDNTHKFEVFNESELSSIFNKWASYCNLCNEVRSEIKVILDFKKNEQHYHTNAS